MSGLPMSPIAELRVTPFSAFVVYRSIASDGKPQERVEVDLSQDIVDFDVKVETVDGEGLQERADRIVAVLERERGCSHLFMSRREGAFTLVQPFQWYQVREKEAVG